MKGMLMANLWALGLAFSVFLFLPIVSDDSSARCEQAKSLKLPEPSRDGKVSVEKALLERRSIRDYWTEGLTLPEISQLLWAAQGITAPGGYRTAPSAGALYPLEVYVIVGKVEGLPAGVYKYRPRGHELVQVGEGDRRLDLCAAALSQSPIKHAPAVLVIAAVYGRTTQKYLARGKQYVHMEVGHVAQNVSLQAVSLNLGTVDIGAFHDSDVKKVVNLSEGEEPLLIMPIGRRIR